MFSQNLARIAIFGLFLTQAFEGNGQIFYPNATSVNDFHVGDTLVVDLVNPYGPARLLRYCSYEALPRDNVTVPSSSTSQVPLDLGAPASLNCYLELTQDPGSYLTSVIFSVSPSNGTIRTWSLGSQSEGQLSPNVVNTLAAPLPPGTSAPINESAARGRPFITLPDDGPESIYKLADNTDCLLVGPSISLHQGCWETLNLNQWLPHWLNETKKCASDAPSDLNCQSQNETWTSTFLREYGITSNDCLHLDLVDGYCQDQHQAPSTQDESPLLTARFEYVKSNIVAIARYFSAWHTALVNAASGAKDAIEPIIDLIDIQKKKKSRIALNAFLTVLGLALSFIPAVGPEAGLPVLATAAANAVIDGVKAVPDLAKKIWPTGGESTVDFQIGALTSLLDNGLRPSLESNFEELLFIVQGLNQTNTSAFLAFAGQGTFSAPTVQGPAAGAASETQKAILQQSMTTFLVSVTLSQNDWQALLVPEVDAEGIFNGDTACPDWASSQCNDNKDAMRCHAHYYSGQCHDTYWWYSLEHKSMYTLIHDGKLDKDATYILTQVFDRNWTTGALLFENANGQSAGFSYNAPLPGLDPSLQQPPTAPGTTSNNNNDTFFLPIASSGLVALGQLPAVHDAQYHPLSAPFTAQTTGVVDESCVSNLNVTIASSWGGNWQ